MRGGVILSVLLVLLVTAALLVQSGTPWIRTEDVRLHSDGVTLAATLSLPRWQQGPFPAVVIVHGSGPTKGRNQRGYVRRLVPYGVAVLLYDKRGVGGSGGTYRAVSVANSKERLGQLAEDTMVAASWLAEHPEIDSQRIGLLGGSQAGWIMPLAASRSEAVRFVVSISGSAVTVGQEHHYRHLTGSDSGIPAELSAEELQERMVAFDGPDGYDPAWALDAMNVPSLWILGGQDLSTRTELTVRKLQGLQERHPGQLVFQVFPQGNHSLREARTGRSIDYWAPIHAWLQERRIVHPPGG